MGRVIHFEFSADNPERAGKFYHDVFGWNIDKWQGGQEYWLVTTGAAAEPGINGGIMRRTNGSGVINTVQVDSIDAAVKKVETCGGKVVMSKQHIPGVGYLARCQDTEGNVFGLLQPEATMK